MYSFGNKVVPIRPSFFLMTSLLMTGAILLSGCNSDAKTAAVPKADKTPIVNGPLCEINDLNQGWDTCKEGQTLAFLPSTWGNEQLPIIATALYCDFHHPIVQNNGGVVCIYTGTRKPVAEPEKEPEKEQPKDEK
jgi:hypothetical protein